MLYNDVYKLGDWKLQYKKSGEVLSQDIYGNVALNANLRNTQDFLKYSTRTKQNGYAPKVIRPVKKKKFVKKKNISIGAAAFVLIATALVSTVILPFSYKNFISPIFKHTYNHSFRVNMAHIYSPTSKYLHNNEFLGVRFLQGAESKKPAMEKMFLSENMPVLENKLKRLAEQYPNVHPSVFVWDYETGKYAALNSNETFPAASIIKVPVLLQFFRSVEAGQHTINDKMTLKDYYRAEGSGDIQFHKTGNQYTMDYLAKKMIQISDNSSTNMLMSSIGGMNDINRAIKSWGLKNTEVNNWLPDMGGTNVTTTEDLTRMLYNIENDEFLSDESKHKIFEYMGGVKNNRLIHAGLNPNAKFFHKTGDIGYMLGDTGIVMTPQGHKYIVSILAKRPYNHPAGKDFIVRASSLIYDSLSARNLN